MSAHVYFARPVGCIGPIKVGFTSNPDQRLANLNSQWRPLQIEFVAVIKGSRQLENRIHTLFADDHWHREWFDASPRLLAAIAAIQHGFFDFSVLPHGSRLGYENRSEASKRATAYGARLLALRRRGLDVPAEVIAASSTKGLEPSEAERCWAIVREYVDRVAPFAGRDAPVIPFPKRGPHPANDDPPPSAPAMPRPAPAFREAA
jgi:hypothetical protein